jgi:hypothetical protein
VVAHDVFLADCPARNTLDLVADTWSVVAVVAPGRGPARYTESQWAEEHTGELLDARDRTATAAEGWPE